MQSGRIARSNRKIESKIANRGSQVVGYYDARGVAAQKRRDLSHQRADVLNRRTW